MYEEPYRWVEAVSNRRHYLDEQFKQGSPVVGLSYADGIVLLTVSRGTPKLYEIYDRIGLGGMGHPADLEKLRFNLLEMAHLEGFNRSPADVTAGRLMKYGLAPLVKQAFEEVFKAPHIVKILLTEIGLKPGKDSFLTINYDGAFEETQSCAVLAATGAVAKQMVRCIQGASPGESRSLNETLEQALTCWAVGSLAQQDEHNQDDAQGEAKASDRSRGEAAGPPPDEARITSHLREALADRSVECAILDRSATGPSKYRPVQADELSRILPKTFQPSA